MVVPHITRQIMEQRCIELWVKSWERQEYERKEVIIDTGHPVDLPARWKKWVPDPDCRSVVSWLSLLIYISSLDAHCYSTGWSFPFSMSQSLRGAHNPFLPKALWVDSVFPSFQATHVCLDRGVRVDWSKNSPSWYLEPLSSQTFRLHHWVWQVMQGFSSFEVNDLQEILQVLLQLTFCWVPLPHQLFWHNPNIWALLPRRLLNSHIIQRIQLETRQFQS